MDEAIKKADVLIEALPYIKKFHKKIIVVKYGGSILGDEKIRKGVLEDIVFLSFVGLRVVLVHGGGPNISERMRASKKKTDFVDGMRVTDAETLRLVEEELLNLNNLIISEITKLGAKAAGLSGKEKNIIQVEKKKAKLDLGMVGHIVAVDSKPILDELAQHKVVVVLPMGAGKDRSVYNVNADESAAAIAAYSEAEKLVLLTNVKGIMRNQEDAHSFMATLTGKEAKELIKNNIIQQGMIPKVNACIWALDKGVGKTHIIDARIPHALLLEILPTGVSGRR